MKTKAPKKTPKRTARYDTEEFTRYGTIEAKAIIEALDRLTEAVWAVGDAVANRP